MAHTAQPQRHPRGLGTVVVIGLALGGWLCVVDTGPGESSFTLRPAHAQGVVYTVTALEPLPGDTVAHASGLNSAADVVGWSGHTTLNSVGKVVVVGQHAVVWRRGNGAAPEDLGALPGHTVAFATAINDAGDVVGMSAPNDDPGPIWLGWVLHGGTMTALGGLATGVSSGAPAAIGQTGFIAGASSSPAGGVHAVRWNVTQPATPLDLGTLPGGFDARGTGVNASGQVVGYSNTIVPPSIGVWVRHPFQWQDGSMRDLGILPGGSDDSEAAAIDDAGQVVGWAIDSNGEHAWLWQSGSGSLTDLGTLGGHYTQAFGINGLGQVVGRSELAAPPGVAPDLNGFLYTEGHMIDLNTLLPVGSEWTLTEAHAINDTGQVVAGGYRVGQTQQLSVLLSPGSGSGTATSTPTAGPTQTATITAIPSPSGTPARTFTATPTPTATGTVTVALARLSVERSGGGAGTVTSNPAGIACGSDCSESYANGTVVTLTATAAAGSAFVNWSGACSGKVPTCTVTMDAAKTVKAAFKLIADLQLIMADSPDPVTAGGTLTYTITATNLGPSDTSKVTVNDTLPSSLTYLSASSTQGSVTTATTSTGATKITLSGAALASGASATLTIEVRPNVAGTLKNSASVTSNVTFDVFTANNKQTAATAVTAAGTSSTSGTPRG